MKEYRLLLKSELRGLIDIVQWWEKHWEEGHPEGEDHVCDTCSFHDCGRQCECKCFTERKCKDKDCELNVGADEIADRYFEITRWLDGRIARLRHILMYDPELTSPEESEAA